MRNFLFWLGHAALIMFFVGLKICEMGYYSYLFLGNAVLMYLVGSMVKVSGTDESLFHGEIDTRDMSPEEKKAITGLIIWRNSQFDHVRYWSRELNSFAQVLEVHERHNLLDYEQAAQRAKTIYQPGMLYFLHDDEFFPKDKTVLN